jgi:hypothetical protein
MAMATQGLRFPLFRAGPTEEETMKPIRLSLMLLPLLAAAAALTACGSYTERTVYVPAAAPAPAPVPAGYYYRGTYYPYTYAAYSYDRYHPAYYSSY